MRQQALRYIFKPINSKAPSSPGAMRFVRHNENTFSPPASLGGKLRVVPGTNNKYEAQETANNHSKFIIGAGNFSTVKPIKRIKSWLNLKLCKFNGQGDKRYPKLYHRDTLEENTVLLEKIVDSSEAAVSIEHLYITRLFHSFQVLRAALVFMHGTIFSRSCSLHQPQST